MEKQDFEDGNIFGTRKNVMCLDIESKIVQQVTLPAPPTYFFTASLQAFGDSVYVFEDTRIWFLEISRNKEEVVLRNI